MHRLNHREASWTFSTKVDGFGSLIDLAFSYIPKSFPQLITIDTVETVVSSIRQDMVANDSRSSSNDLRGEMLFVHVQNGLRKAVCCVLLALVPNLISSTNYHSFRVCDDLYLRDKVLTKALASLVALYDKDSAEGPRIPDLYSCRNRVVISFDIGTFSPSEIQKVVAERMGDVFEFAMFVSVVKGKRSRLVSNKFVKSGQKFPHWMIGFPSRETIKAGISDDIWLSFDPDGVELDCERRHVGDGWSSAWIDLIKAITNSDVVVRSVCEKFSINVSLNVVWDRSVAQRTIEEDYLLSRIVDLSEGSVGKEVDEIVLHLRPWSSEPFRPGTSVSVTLHIPKGKYQRVTKAQISSTLLLAESDKILIAIITNTFCSLYAKAHRRCGAFRNDTLINLRRELPEYILNNYSRENPIIPLVVDFNEARMLSSNGRSVIKFPKDDPAETQAPKGKFLTAPEGYFIGIKFSRQIQNYIPVCYKKNNLLNRNSTTWKYFYGSDSFVVHNCLIPGMIEEDSYGTTAKQTDAKGIAKESKGSSFMTTQRSMPMGRKGVLPSDFVLDYLGDDSKSFCYRLGLGSRLLSSLLNIFDRKIDAVVCNNDSLHIEMSSTDESIKISKCIYAALCRQELQKATTLEISKILCDGIKMDEITPHEYRLLEELFDVTIVWFLTTEGTYKGIRIPVCNARERCNKHVYRGHSCIYGCNIFHCVQREEKMYLWNRRRRPLVILFVNKFQMEITYEIVVRHPNELNSEGTFGPRIDGYKLHDPGLSMSRRIMDHMESITLSSKVQDKQACLTKDVVGQFITSDGKCYAVTYLDEGSYRTETCFSQPLCVPELEQIRKEKCSELLQGIELEFCRSKENALKDIGNKEYVRFDDESLFLKWSHSL